MALAEKLHHSAQKVMELYDALRGSVGADDDELASQTSAVAPSPTMPWSPFSYARFSLSARGKRKRGR